MSKESKELMEDGVGYGRSEYGVVNVKGLRTSIQQNDGGKLSANEIVKDKDSKNLKSVTMTQVKNINTGHWIKRDEISGEFIAGNNSKPFKGTPVRRKFKAAANPSITREMAELAEKAVLSVLNRSSKG